MTVGHELHIETIRAAHRLLQSGTTSRIYEKWLAEYNPLLSADWSFAQKFILEAAENTETNLLEVLLQIFTRHEYSTKCTVLQFVFNLI